MTNEEAMSILSDMSWRDDIDGWVISDKEHKAICIAMKAIENQEKHKNALEIAVREMVTLAKKVTRNSTPVEELVKDGVKRYEKKAGIEN